MNTQSKFVFVSHLALIILTVQLYRLASPNEKAKFDSGKDEIINKPWEEPDLNGNHPLLADTE